MFLRLFALSIFVCCSANALASASLFDQKDALKGLVIYQQAHTPVISYKVQNKRDAFLASAKELIDEDGILVRHVVNISTQELDFDRDFDVQAVRYAKFDKVANKMLCGESENLLKAMTNDVVLAKCLFDVARVPVGKRGDALQTGVTYDVTISISLEPMGRSNSFSQVFNPSTYFDESIKVETTYIGR